MYVYSNAVCNYAITTDNFTRIKNIAITHKSGVPLQGIYSCDPPNFIQNYQNIADCFYCFSYRYTFGGDVLGEQITYYVAFDA